MNSNILTFLSEFFVNSWLKSRCDLKRCQLFCLLFFYKAYLGWLIEDRTRSFPTFVVVWIVINLHNKALPFWLFSFVLWVYVFWSKALVYFYFWDHTSLDVIERLMLSLLHNILWFHLQERLLLFLCLLTSSDQEWAYRLGIKIHLSMLRTLQTSWILRCGIRDIIYLYFGGIIFLLFYVKVFCVNLIAQDALFKPRPFAHYRQIKIWIIYWPIKFTLHHHASSECPLFSAIPHLGLEFLHTRRITQHHWYGLGSLRNCIHLFLILLKTVLAHCIAMPSGSSWWEACDTSSLSYII